jgi:hypothetical protein
MLAYTPNLSKSTLELQYQQQQKLPMDEEVDGIGLDT